ncbi:MAG TPA: sulfatase-like hydrolase/transferase [Vicinamibacteria bacterium]
MRASWALAAAALAAALAGAWWVRGRGPAVRREAGLSVLLVTVDTLRADALGSYGKADARTPWLDRLAREGVRFEQAHAHNVVTLPSHANILSGRYPFEHGVRDNAGFRFPPSMETLATILKARGYRTGAFVSAFPLDSRFGLDRGFDVYDDRFGDHEAGSAFAMEERTGAETAAEAAAFMRASAAPTLTWLHLYDPHAPYAPPAPFAAAFPDAPYHGEVAAVDAALGTVLQPLLEAGRDGRTLVVLTSDHGESLGEHGEKTHGIFTYEGALRVPLVLFQPRLFAPRVASAWARHVDVLPTVLDALDVPLPPGLSGTSLLPAAAGQGTPGVAAYFESLSPMLARGWAPAYGVLAPPLKYIELPDPELYDLARDGAESANLVSGRAEDRERLQGLLAGFRRRDRGAQARPEDGDVRRRLAALGYVASAAAAPRAFGPDDDPKRLIRLDALLEQVLDLHAAGEGARAEAVCRELVAQRPGMPLAWRHLAFLRSERGDSAGAVEAARRALALAPEDAETAAALGNYLNEWGRPAEALALLAPYAERASPDLDVLMAMATALAYSGRGAEALAVLERARALDASSALVLANIGTVHLAARDYARAAAAFAAALEREPALARAHNGLGVVAAENGRTEEAIGHWRKAVAANPREYDTLFNLGLLLRRAGRADEARAHLRRFVETAPPARYAEDIARARRWLQ